MSIFSQFKQRSTEEEIIDDFSMAGDEVIKTFKTIERVNTLLGGNQVLVSGVARMIRQLRPNKKQLHLFDLGCGSGDGLRAMAKWARKKGISLQLSGIDANGFIVDYARSQAKKYPKIRFLQQDIFDPGCSLKEADLVTFNLCLHHFTEKEQIDLLEKCRAENVQAILINDLHRHWLAYYSFGVFCRLTGANRIAREDGLLSIKKGFKKEELVSLAKKAGFKRHSVRWKWAFRYEMSLFME